MVVASNFLCHMEAAEAENCLRNMARLAWISTARNLPNSVAANRFI
jgi:hypothetical protein